jgi:hypothetical protein
MEKVSLHALTPAPTQTTLLEPLYCREPRIRPAGDCNKFIRMSYVSLIIVYASLYIESFFQKYTSIHVHAALLTLHVQCFTPSDRTHLTQFEPSLAARSWRDTT